MTKSFEYYKEMYGEFVTDKDIGEALMLFESDESVVKYLNYIKEVRAL